MTITYLFGLIVAQILAFQFAGARLGRIVPSYLVGTQALPPEISAAAAGHAAGSARARRALGLGLLVLAGLIVLIAPPGTVRKLALAAVSLVSSAAFLAGYFRDRRVAAVLAAALPAPAVRTASLERPQLRSQYPLAWEAVPVAIGAVSVGLALWAVRWSGWEAGLLGLAASQVALVAGGLWMAGRYAGAMLPQRARAHLGTPDTAQKIATHVVRVELRAWLAARIGMGLLVGLWLADRALFRLRGRDGPEVFAAARWVVVGLLLATLALFIWSVARRAASEKR